MSYYSSSQTDLTQFNDVAQPFGRETASPESTWSPRTSFIRHQDLDPRLRTLCHPHLDPRLRTPEDTGKQPISQISRPQPKRCRRGNKSELIPRARREIIRLAQYHLSVKTKKEMRHIVRRIQSKRREEFRVLRDALREVYNYSGKFLQGLGDKEAAAHVLRAGGLAWEFLNEFEEDAKWQWLQLRVDTL
ncbi:hypothetical protein DFH28DRAFT_934062 [Melampsora americana]|nr:hypothetical protein DFH28DRAFT_934062 [Melampsora americana]